MMKNLDINNISRLQEKIIEIAKSFVTYKPNDFDRVIYSSLRTLGEVLEVDRAYIFEYNFTANTMDNTYEWVNKGVNPEKNNLKGIPVSDFLDGWVNEHRKNKNVIVDDVDKLDKASNLYKILKPQHIKSLLTIPIFINDICFGYIGFDLLHEQNKWDSYVKLLKVLPEFYSSAFSRHLTLKELDSARKEAVIATSYQADFLAKVTHELKTPINGVSSSLYLMEQTDLDDEQMEYVDIMKYSIETLSNMVYNILNYSKIENNKLDHKSTDVDLEQEVIKLIRMNKFMASSKELGMYFDFDYDIPSIVSADIEKLRQVLNNLIQNAIKYTNYGYVDVKVSLLKQHFPYVDILFEIKDTGIGISKYDAEHIFDEFYQVGDALNKNPSGTGLGLTITKDLVSFMKGTLKVESEERKGSNFNFALTLYTPTEEKRIPLDMKALYIDLYDNYHTNVTDFLDNHFLQHDSCTGKNCGNFHGNDYDVVFIYANEPKVYKEVLPDLKPLIQSFGEDTKSILLYDNPEVYKQSDSSELLDNHVELPAVSSDMIDKLNKIEQIKGNHKASKTKKEVNFLNRLTILLVDDNNINRKVMTKLLRNMNLGVAEAANGYEAIELVKDRQFDIIFMDIFMPGIDGYEASKRIRELGETKTSIPIIAVTANDVESTLERALEYGMNGVLSKPLKKEELEELLNEYFPKEEFDTLSKEEPIFDVEEFESFYDEEDMRGEIIQAFLEERENDLKRIDEAFRLNSLKQIYKAAHYLKGSFTYLSAKKSLKLSKMIMELCNQERLEEASNLEQTLILYYEELSEELKKQLVKYQ